MTKTLALLLAVLLLGGCVSAQVQRGALIGAASGLVAGGTVGLLISDPNLYGTPKSVKSSDPAHQRELGQLPLPEGPSILAGAAIGTVLGAIIGAMVGHRRDEGYETPPKPASAPAGNKAESGGASTASNDGAQDARPPYLRGL